MNNIALITLDSLRYDVASVTTTPIIDSLGPSWFKAYSNGTDTYTSHSAMLKFGHLPHTMDQKAPKYLRYKLSRYYLFRAVLSLDKNRRAKYSLPVARNIVRGFSKLGYRTVGIGGVDWFNTNIITSEFWNQYFDEFYWKKSFSQSALNCFDHQVDFAVDILKNHDKVQPLFFFLNISATHNPSFIVRNQFKTQQEALQYVDSKIKRIFDLIPKPCHIILTGDHGSVFEEDNYITTGHGFYHQKVMTVPIKDFLIM